MQSIISGVGQFTVHYPPQETVADDSLRCPPNKQAHESRGFSPEAAKLIGAGVTVAGAAMALQALSRLPRADASLPPHPAVHLGRYAVNEFYTTFVNSMNALGCLVVCRWHPDNVETWCRATAVVTATIINVRAGQGRTLSGAVGLSINELCQKSTSDIIHSCAAMNCH